jgi:hypothetical protein
MILDSDKLFAAIDKQIADCTRAIEQGMFPQVLDDVREERRDLRSLRGHLRDVVVFATKHVPASAPETGRGECEHNFQPIDSSGGVACVYCNQPAQR